MKLAGSDDDNPETQQYQTEDASLLECFRVNVNQPFFFFYALD